MSNWYIYDNQITDTLGFEVSWLSPEAYRYVTPHINHLPAGKTLVSLEAGPYVGTLPLNNRDTLYIIPRAGRESFSRMMFVVEGIEEAARKEFEEFVNLGYTEAGHTPWSVLLARPFISRLRMIEKESLVTNREASFRRLGYVRGRVKFTGTLISLARNDENPIHTFLREPTHLNLENRLLSTASAVLLRVGNLDDMQRQVVARWAGLCRGNYITLNELRNIISGIRTHKFTGSRSYYVSALVMARLIIFQTGISLESSNGIEGEPLVTNIADLFEKYIRTLIGRYLLPKGYLVEKNERQPPSLFSDGTCKLKPDIIISQQGTVKLIADVKYKPRPVVDTSDYYQMSIYLDNFGINVGLLVLPNPNQSEHNLIKRETVKGKCIFELRLPLNDWEKSESALLDTIAVLV